MMPPETTTTTTGTGTKQRKDRKVLNPQAKEIIVNVVSFMKREASGEFVIPARKVQCRAAHATGFSERTVRRVVKESRSLADETFPPKKVLVRAKPKTGLDDLTRCSVRKIIHGIYAEERSVPTIKRIHERLVKEIAFKGGSRSAHKIIKELGFFWKKTPSKALVLVEKHDIRFRRIEYLRSIVKLRREGRAIVYIGDIVTSVQDGRLVLLLAGGERGFTPRALVIHPTSTPDDGHQEEIASFYHLWIQNSLLPDLPPRSIVVMDDARYQCFKSEKIPTADCSTDEMKEWLKSKNIGFVDGMLRPELHQIIKKHAPKYRRRKGKIEQLLGDGGHSILRIPSGHPDLNPVCLMLSDVKGRIRERNSGSKVEDASSAIQQTLSELVAQVWMTKCSQVESTEQDYLKSERIVDHEVERIMYRLPGNKEALKNEPGNSYTVENGHCKNSLRQLAGDFLVTHDCKALKC